MAACQITDSREDAIVKTTTHKTARHMVRSVAAPLLVVGLLTTAQAGWYYEATTTSSGDQQRTDTTEVRVWVEGDNTRIEFTEDGNAGFGSDGSYMISTDAGNTLYLVDPEEQTYTEFNLGEMMGMAGQVMEQMGGMFKMEFTDFHSEKLSESAGENLLGYDTRQMHFKSGYTMNMTVMGRTTSNVVDMDQRMWVTDAIDARAFNAWLRPDKRMSGMVEGLDEMMEQSFSQVDGIPLRSEVRSTTTDSNGKQQVSNQTTVVTTLRQENVPAERFQIPDGYARQSLKREDETAPQEEEDVNPMDMLKDMFGRGGE